MSNPVSLEIQKREVLARIHTSREQYRHLLNSHAPLANSHSSALPLIANDRFPRSNVMRWIMANPYWCVGGAMAVALIGPGHVIGAVTRLAGTGKMLAGFTATAAGKTLKFVPVIAQWLPMILNNQRQRATLPEQA